MKVFFLIISASLLIGLVDGIIGGRIVKSGTKKYMTGVRTSIDPASDDDFSFCGGVLISSTHVLTTASCTTTASAKGVSIAAHYINGGNDGDEIKVADVKNHPQFNNKTLANDFAVLTLVRPTKINPVKLPAIGGSEIQSGMWATAMGWGLTSNSPNAMGSEELLQLSQQVITNDACRKAPNTYYLDMSQVCAVGKVGMSPCQGDTGGPLIRENSKGDDDDVLIALISDGKCGMKNSPAIYARVSSALTWINTVIKA